MQQCQNCLQQFPQDKISTHFGYCRRNIKKCPQCNNLYDINNKEQHDEQYHKKIGCRYCKIQLSANDVSKHQDTCTKRTKYCQYCQLNVPVAEYDRHLKGCQARTRNCEYCGGLVRVGEYLGHVAVCVSQNSMSGKEGNNKKGGNHKLNGNHKNNYLFDTQKDQLTDFVEKKQANFKKKQSQKYTMPSRNASKPSQPTSTTNTNTNTRTSSRGINPRSKPEQSHPSKHLNSNSNPLSNPISNPISNSLSNPISNSIWSNPAPKQMMPKMDTKLPKKPTQQKQQSYGVKRPIANGIKKQQSNSNSHAYAQIPKKQQSKPNKISSNIDYRDFNDYYQNDEYNDDIPAQLLFPSHNPNHNPKTNPSATNLKQFDQDEQIQKAILQSMEQQNKSIKNSRKNNMEKLPKDLQTEELMRASWSKDFDIQKQMAIYQDIQRKANKNKK